MCRQNANGNIAGIPTDPLQGHHQDPKLVTIAKPGEISSLEKIVTFDAETKLHNLDFGKDFAVAVFRGVRGTTGYGVEIKRVIQRRGTITIDAHFIEHDWESGLGVSPIVTSPYHLVKMQRERLQGKIEFVLNSDGVTVSRQTYFFP